MQTRIVRLSLWSLAVFNLVMLMPWLIHGQAISNGEAERALERARAAFRRNELNAAKQELKLAWKLKGNWPESSLLSALIAEQEKDNREAIKHLKSALQLQPNYALANFVLARLYFAEARREDSIAAIRLALQQGAEFADAYCLLGDIELAFNRIEPALDAYLRATQQPPPNKTLNADFRLRVEALQYLMEFQRHRDEPGYEWPKRQGEDVEARNNTMRKFASGVQPKMLEFGGVLTAQGLVQVVVLGDNGKAPRPIYNKGYSIKSDEKFVVCTPAKKNGVPVPFWFRWKDFP